MTFPEKLIDTLDIAVLSPGVPTDLPVVENAMRDKKVAVIGEVELAYAFGKGDVLAITGTNGKTTTTTLLGEIMKAYKEHTYVVGNIGNPYTVAARQMEEDAVAVAEMSSFQLESIVTFRPKVSAILELYTGSSESSSHDGSICECKEEYCKEPDSRRLLYPELRGRENERVRRTHRCTGDLFQQQTEVGKRNISG